MTARSFLIKLSLAAAVTLLLSSCAHQNSEETLRSIAETYVPDKRLGVFDIDFREGKVFGFTTSTQAKDALLAAFKQAEPSVIVLPARDELDGKVHGFVRVPVATFYEAPSYTAPVLTQAVLGSPVDILRNNRWLQVRLPDGYIAWVSAEQISACTEDEFRNRFRQPQYLVTATETALRQKPGDSAKRLALLPSMARLFQTDKKHGIWKPVQLPDGRFGYVKAADIQSTTEFVRHWDAVRESPERYGSALVKLAEELLGQSYLWAGTSTFGVDCSGFTQTVYLRTGLILPRDADLQAETGPQVFPPYRAGDLLFFGKKATASSPEKISHVALSLGGNRFIHSRADVRTGSLSPLDDDYDDYEKKRFLKAVRPDLTTLRRITDPSDTNPSLKTNAERNSLR